MSPSLSIYTDSLSAPCGKGGGREVEGLPRSLLIGRAYHSSND